MAGEKEGFNYDLPRSKVLYVRVDEDLKKLIEGDSEATGMTMATICAQRLKKSFAEHPIK